MGNPSSPAERPIHDVTEVPIADLVSLAGRTAVITGAAQGLGFAIARRFVEAGARVVLTDVNAAGVAAAAEQLTGGPTTAEGFALDVTDQGAVHALADGVAADHGTLDVWVNVAGAYPVVPFVEMSEDDWKSLIDLNLHGTFAGAQAAARHMVPQGSGVIVNMASVVAHAAFSPGLAHYSASKNAVIGLTRSLAVELGPFGVRALALSPTLITTDGIQASRDDFESVDGVAEAQDALVTRHPLRRLGVPDDVARVALFAASDLSLLMTGSDLLVDAGLLAV